MKNKDPKSTELFVEVAVAEDLELAQDYVNFLHESGIPAKIKKSTANLAFGTYILVPAREYEVAYDMISMRNDYEQTNLPLFNPADSDEVRETEQDQFLFIDPNRAA